MTFYIETPIKSIRKARRCNGCSRMMNAGEPALKCVGNYDGFFSATFHEDCRRAEVEYNHDIINYVYDDVWYSVLDIFDEDRGWLTEKYPQVASRLKG